MADVKFNAQGSDLHGGTLVNAATAQLQEDMIEAIKQIAKAQGIDTREANKKVKKFTDAVSDTTDEQIDLSKATGVASKGFGTASKVMSKFGDIAHRNARVADSLPGPLKGMASGISGVLKWMGPLGSGFAILSGVVGAYVAYSNQLLDNWMELSSSGTTFAGSMHEARQAAIQFGLSTQEFAQVVRKGSESFAMAFGTAEEGARQFAAMGQIMRRRFGLELREMGITANEAAQYLSDYVEMNRLSDNFRRQSTLQQASAAKELVVQMDALAKLTGKSREEQAAALKKEAMRADFQAKLMTLDEEAREASLQALKQAESAGPQAADMFISSFLGRAPVDKATQVVAAAAPEFAATMQRMADAALAGSFDLEKSLREMAASGSEVQNAFIQFGQYASLGGIAGETAKGLATLNEALTPYIRGQEEAARKGITLRESLESLQSAAEDTAGGLQFREVLDQLIDQFRTLLDTVVQVFNKTFLPEIRDNVVPALKALVENLDPEDIKKFFDKTMDQIGAVARVFRAIIEKIASWLDIDLRSEAERLRDSIGELGDDLSKTRFGDRAEDQDKLREQLQRMAEIDPSKAQEAFDQLYKDFQNQKIGGRRGLADTPENRALVREQFIERYGMTPGSSPGGSRPWAEPVTPSSPEVSSPNIPEESGFREGGVSQGSESGYTAKLHGTEAVVPLPDGRKIPVEQIGQDQAQMAFEKMIEKMNIAIREIQESNKHLKNIAQLSS